MGIPCQFRVEQKISFRDSGGEGAKQPSLLDFYTMTGEKLLVSSEVLESV